MSQISAFLCAIFAESLFIDFVDTWDNDKLASSKQKKSRKYLQWIMQIVFKPPGTLIKRWTTSLYLKTTFLQVI